MARKRMKPINICKSFGFTYKGFHVKHGSLYGYSRVEKSYWVCDKKHFRNGGFITVWKYDEKYNEWYRQNLWSGDIVDTIMDAPEEWFSAPIKSGKYDDADKIARQYALHGATLCRRKNCHSIKRITQWQEKHTQEIIWKYEGRPLPLDLEEKIRWGL